MLGIIVEAQTEDKHYPNRILHKFHGKSSVERVVEAGLKSEYASRVLVAMSKESRPFAAGTTYRDTVIDQKISGLDRIATYSFHKKPPLERVYYTARDYNIDIIVRLKADSPFLPTWLINEVIYSYYQEPNVFLHNVALPGASEEEAVQMYPEGLNIEIMPFWMLARAIIYINDESEFYSYVSNNFKTKKFMNSKDSPNYIHRPDFSLKFSKKEQIPSFDAMFEELKYNDLGDLLKDMSSGQG